MPPDPSLIPSPGVGHDATVLALAFTAAYVALRFLRKLGDLYLKRLAKKWDVADKENAEDD